MTAINKTTWLAAILWVSISAGSLRAQDAFSDSFGTSDLQFFAPVDFDFENQPIGKSSGYFFRYDKLSWAATDERTPVGDPNVTYLAQSPFTGGAVADPPVGAAPTPFTIVNGISDIAPLATFAWGERYEFGKFNKNNGWQISVLDGPEFSSGQNFGFGVGNNPFGFGSVHIGFTTTNPDYLVGFFDIMQNATPENGSIDNILNPPSIARIIDDINGNGTFDLGDTILFLPIWEQVNVSNQTEIDGIELMRSYRVDNSHKLTRRQNSRWEFAYGVRYFRLRDQFKVSALGGVFGDSNWDTKIDNHLVGPQLQVRWERQRSRWNLNAQGRFMFGYNVQDMNQIANIGPALIPGSQTSPIFADPTVSSAGKRDDDFAPLGEFRVDVSYQVTNAISLRLGYTATYINNIRRAAKQVKYELPNMGFRDGGTQEIFINGATFGFNVVF